MRKQQFIDLSHTIEDGMITYKGFPAPVICDFWSREHSSQFYGKDTSFQIGKIEMIGNTGTYLDSPFHRYAHGNDLADLNLESLSNIEGILIDCSAKESGQPQMSDFLGKDVRDKAVLVRTDWSKKWGTNAYFHGHPYITKAMAKYLQESEVKLVGIDSYNIDDTTDEKRPVHSILLASGIPIVEHMCNLESLVNKSFLFSAVPPKIKSMGSFPVRAHAILR